MPPQSTPFTEARTVENPILKWLRTLELGWRYENQQAVIKKYRTDANGVYDEREVLLLPILRLKLKELNPGVITDDDRADRIIFQLRTEKDNQEWLRWLRNEKTFQFAPDEQYQTIKLVDYDDIENNDFLATNQFWVEGAGGRRRRTDALLFLNGIPIVNAEAKTTTRDDHIEWREGAKQTGDYLRDVPQLYYSNAFCCGVNELKMFYGVPGVPFHKWHQWRDPAPHQIDRFDEMKCGVFGLLDRGNLLDLLRHFIVFETEDGKAVKKVARYQQFRAANKLVSRALELGKPRGWRRGIVWHTQGSGKSLTILFAARKLWSLLNQPTIIIVVDRDQLQDQMVKQFVQTNTENCRVAESKDDLLALLRDGDGYRGIILTIMHKFDWRDAVEINRSDVIMMVDEAHRTQYGELAIGMRKLLPQASMFGFTGTPLELDDRNTPVAFGQEQGKDASGQEVFERYLDRYSIADALRDRATVPIRWEPRMTDWKVWGKALDEQFERHFAHLSPEERNALKTQEARLEVILKLPRRIAQIAQDVADHFKKHVQPNKFKAMLVCWDKETCALYKAALDELLGKDVSLCIFSEDPLKDKESVKQHYLGEATRKKAIDEFKKPKPEDPAELAKPENRFRNVELFIVCDMLLTGFDAPILQTMYLDKGLRDHTLLQAIARVNRPYNELKNGWGENGEQGRGGLVIDYFGVFENLNEALNFDKNELGTIAYPFSMLRERFRLEIGLLSEMFKNIDRSGSHESLMKALTFLNQDEPARDKFEEGYKNVRILYEAVQPDPSLAEYEREYVWLTKLWMAYRKKFYPRERYEISEEDGAKTRELIRQHVRMEELKKAFPTYELNESYLAKLDEVPPDAKALDIEAMLAAELKIRLEEDEDYQPLSERLKRIVNQKRAGTLAGIALIAELERLSKEVVEMVAESKRPLRDQIAKLVFERCPDVKKSGQSDDVADAMLGKANELCFPEWFFKEEMDTALYREFTMLLAGRFGNLGLHGKGKDFVDRCIKLLKKARFTGGSGGPGT
jgi:type I restriction enzyme R subunit